MADSTQGAYTTGWNCYKTFVTLSGHSSPYCSNDGDRENIMCLFVTHCASNLRLAHSTIKMYLAAIKFNFIKSGKSHPFIYSNGTSFGRLHYTLRGIKKCQINCINPRLPITTELLYRIRGALSSRLFSPYMDKMFLSCCLLAFFGFLRCGEFTTSGTFDPSTHLTLNDIQFQEWNHVQIIQLRLKSSKTDPFREGVILNIFQTSNSLCPVASMQQYLALRYNLDSNPDSPLFCLQDRTPLTRLKFSTMLQSVLRHLQIHNDMYKPHSFRIGACSMAARMGVPDSLIKVLGRWSSDCFQRYIRVPKESLQKAHIAMSKSMNE